MGMWKTLVLVHSWTFNPDGHVIKLHKSTMMYDVLYNEPYFHKLHRCQIFLLVFAEKKHILCKSAAAFLQTLSSDPP